MSYRSQVAIVFHKPSLTEGQLTRAKEILGSLAEGKSNLITEDDTFLQFYHEHYRWQDLNKNIKEFYQFLETLNLDSYEFLRVGEEAGDVEQDGEGGMGLGYIFMIDQASLPLEPY